MRPRSFIYRPGVDLDVLGRLDDLESSDTANAADVSALQSSVSSLQTSVAAETLSGVHDPSVTGLAAAIGAEYTRTSEYQPKTLAKLNEIFAPWGATFAHAWRFQAASGSEPDLALAGGIALANNNEGFGAPTQNVSTGETDYETDKAVESADAGLTNMSPVSATDLDVTTGSVFVLMTVRLPAAPSGASGLVGKALTLQTHYWMVSVGTDGKLKFSVSDGGTSADVTTAADHTGATYVDLLAILDRASASKLMALVTSIEDAGTAVPGLLSVTGDKRFAVGWVREGPYAPAAPSRVTFVGVGTVPGTLLANRVAALAAYTNARKAGAQLWIKRGAADTEWSKVGP